VEELCDDTEHLAPPDAQKNAHSWALALGGCPSHNNERSKMQGDGKGEEMFAYMFYRIKPESKR